MVKQDWEIVDTVVGDLQAELLRGLLEAQNIPVYLSQEGVGRSVYVVSVGPLANVHILVPSTHLQQAKKILEEYYAGVYKIQDDESEEEG